MNQNSTIRNKSSVATSLLLVLMYSSSLFAPAVHSLFHAHDYEEVCEETDNACHLKLVHHDFENGCDHKSHITNEINECEYCPLLHLQKAPLVNLWNNYSQYPVNEQLHQFIETEQASKYVVAIPGRGPPLIS